ncbi:agip135 [Agrotis ipsilon multiple nucleopolyhedrovirus]|uniref:Uncharacterized protein n=1 Tax=Agrotis ipsilon multiple nucleopolyhedrovirus TaxID=208013 RepID=B6D649_9ABAC|nr:agip135 [Agrotis ipsilon multiple nucleopolyhedrovirus]ACI28836.1 unknown [Agrotis ipsilon multiple nucleopolyhedrovirus]
MIVPNAKISPLMQFKCEYLSAVAVYLQNGAAYKMPDISDLDLQDTLEFLMYVPIEAAPCSSSTEATRKQQHYCSRTFIDKLHRYARYAQIPNPDKCEFCFDIYDFDNISFGGSVINNVGVLCTKNSDFYYMLLSAVTYELYARLDFFKHFVEASSVAAARHALEMLTSIKVCAQIVCGLLCINNKNMSNSQDVLLKHLFNLCLDILKPDFLPACNELKYKSVFEMAQYFRQFVCSASAMVTDLRVPPADSINFIVRNHQHKADTVDMFSFYMFRAEFLERLCATLNIQYVSGANAQICFHVTFLRGNLMKSNIVEHITQYVNNKNEK